MQYAIILIVLAIISTYRKVTAGLKLDFEFGLPYQIQVQVQNLQVVFVQPVSLVNRSDTRLTLNSVDLNFETSQGGYIGRVILPAANYLIPANTTTTIPVEVRINTVDLFRVFPDIRQQVGELKLSVRYKGTVKAEGFTIPINELFTLDRAFFNL